MAKQRHKFKDAAIYVLVVATGFIVRQLPRSASLRLGAGLGDIIYRTVKRRRQIALKNLSMALGSEKPDDKLKHIARSSFQNMGKTLVEFLSTPGYSAERLRSLARIEGMQNIQQAAARGKGTIFISAHLGNWELIFQIMSRSIERLSAVVQSFKHHRLDRLVNSYRTRYGGQVIKKEVAAKQSLRLLRQGLGVAFLGDQDAGHNGVFVDFFGIPASTPRGPVMLALRTDASIINILDIRQEDDSHLITASEPVELEISGDLEKDVEFNTARLVKHLEETVREHPCQWLWMHNRWKTRPKPAKDSPASSIQHPVSSIQYPASSILILSDGKPGHYNQSLGIMDRMRDVLVKTIQVKFKRKWRDNLLRVSARILGGVKLPRDLIKAMLQWAMESSSAAEILRAGCFEAILSTGSSVAAPNLLLGQLTGAKTAVCTRPSPVGISHFDLAILPAHTRSRRHANNAVETLGVPNRITPEYVNQAGAHLVRELEIGERLRIIGLLLGGDDRHYSIPPGMVSALCDILLDVCQEIDFHIILTTSRRTAPESEHVIREKVLGNPLCCLAILASEPQQENPVPGILGVSQVTIVTEDSFSMVCEAASSGRKIIILEVERKKQGHLKRQKVYQLLTERGYTKTVDMSNLKSVIMDSIVATEIPRALDDAQTAADALRELISRG
jgi:lauroyl/myristoyl acyltransferase/mitochondrial fission protein ELM1